MADDGARSVGAARAAAREAPAGGRGGWTGGEGAPRPRTPARGPPSRSPFVEDKRGGGASRAASRDRSVASRGSLDDSSADARSADVRSAEEKEKSGCASAEEKEKSGCASPHVEESAAQEGRGAERSAAATPPEERG